MYNLYFFSQGAAFVEFDVHLSRDLVPIIYHDLTCCIAMKKVLKRVNYLQVGVAVNMI